MNTETKHTPKWIVERASFYSVAYDGYPPIVTCEAVDICEPNPALKDCDAVAALIASAPDMAKEIAQLKADKAELVAGLQRAEKLLTPAFNPGGDDRILTICRAESQWTCNQARALIAKHSNTVQ